MITLPTAHPAKGLRRTQWMSNLGNSFLKNLPQHQEVPTFPQAEYPGFLPLGILTQEPPRSSINFRNYTKQRKTFPTFLTRDSFLRLPPLGHPFYRMPFLARNLPQLPFLSGWEIQYLSLVSLNFQPCRILVVRPAELFIS